MRPGMQALLWLEVPRALAAIIASATQTIRALLQELSGKGVRVLFGRVNRYLSDISRRRIAGSSRSESSPLARGARRRTRDGARLSSVEEIGLDPAAYGTHSVRRTKPSLIYSRTKNLRAVQLLLGHTKLENPVRYLGIEAEDALELAEQTEV
jgi:hypothetical protein